MDADRSYQIYVVDPDDAVRDGIRILLDSFGVRVHSYSDGNSFLNEAVRTASGCVLVEAMLPDGSGVDLVKNLRRAGNIVPVLMMTSSPEIGLTRQAVSHGAASVLRKPLASEQLLGWLEALLRVSDNGVRWQSNDNSLVELRPGRDRE